jgi:hypothetical protein
VPIPARTHELNTQGNNSARFRDRSDLLGQSVVHSLIPKEAHRLRARPMALGAAPRRLGGNIRPGMTLDPSVSRWGVAKR